MAKNAARLSKPGGILFLAQPTFRHPHFLQIFADK
jgi:hypothetical protein